MNINIEKEEIEQTSNKTLTKYAIETQIKITTSHSLSDHNFPESLSSIGTDIRSDLDIKWVPAEQFVTNANYSDKVENLEEPEYCNPSLTHCLLILNWFVPRIFSEIFSQRMVSKISVYEYVLTIEGVIWKLNVNSNIPIKDGDILFADPINGSLFPVLYEKVIAKSYGSYEFIPDDLFKILEIWTGYAPQVFNPKQYSSETFLDYFDESFNNGNLVFFRSRNSIRLESIEFPSGKIYIISKVCRISGVPIVEFLELESTKWKGKHSKKSEFWANRNEEIKEHQINLEEGKENYLSIKDLLGISREIMILHNTSNYHKNWMICKSDNFKRAFKLSLKGNEITHVMINLHFHDRNCRSCIYIICEETSELISCSFKEAKSKNFIAANLNPNLNYMMVVYAEDVQQKSVRMNVSVFSSSDWVDISEKTPNIFMEERSFLLFMTNMSCPSTSLQEGTKNMIKIKNMSEEIGMGFLTVFLEPSYSYIVQLIFDFQKLSDNGIEPINIKSEIMEYEGPCHAIVMFRFKAKIKRKGKFPPEDCLKVKMLSNKRVSQPLFY